MNATPLKLKSTADAPVINQPHKRDWRVLVVDDDAEVHSVTRMILGKMRYKERNIELLAAHSAAEARALLEREHDIAAILLDVVMETDDAGLKLVKVIREELGNQAVRIILRTGQPGQAPEERVIVDYDINDYKAKSELTAQKLFTTVIAALRSYETIMSLEKTRVGLEKILDSTSSLFQVHSMQQFASGVLTQLSAFLDCQPNGIICMQYDPDTLHAGPAPCDDLRILASTGEYGDCTSCPLDGRCNHTEILGLVRKALTEHRSQLTDEYTVIYLETGEAYATAALLHGGLGTADDSDRKLLEVFSSKVSIALANALTYQKMITAEQAATTDFLTGLNNRRQLLRLGLPLVAGAHRTATPLAVAMLDIDHFKRINDTWGHDAGDEVLRRVATLLRERFRSSDVVARFGGEEFCVIAANIGAAEAFELFDAFRKQLAAECFEFDGQAVALTISIGIATEVINNIDAMISAADALLYRAKKNGRNRVEIGS
jgi:diguanylate cyclase (GGDEF)-like protein